MRLFIFISGGPLKSGKCRVLFGVGEDNPIVSVVGLGTKEAKQDPLEERDAAKEAVRVAVAGELEDRRQPQNTVM